MAFQKCPLCDGLGYVDKRICVVCDGNKIIDSKTGKPPKNEPETLNLFEYLIVEAVLLCTKTK